MLLTNLIYVFNPQEQILLCAKKKTNSWFTVSLWKRNGAWGKVSEWETPLLAAQRELEEETMIQAPLESFEHMGIIHFSFATKKEWNQECHVYCIKNYTGSFQESEEMKPQWFNIANIPYATMRADDIYRMPRMLAWEYVEYRFDFTDEGEIVNHEVLK